MISYLLVVEQHRTQIVIHALDRKSGSAGMPRPNSYAVFCLKKKMGRITLDKLAVDDVAGLMRTKQAEERLSTRSVRYVLFILRNALNKAVRWGLVGRNVAALVDPPRVRYKDVRVLSPEETTKLLTAARGDPLEGLVVLAVSTGVRLGEALGVTWADIDL